MTRASPSRQVASSPRTLDDLNSEIFEEKREIRRHKEQLRTLARERDAVIEQLNEFGVEVVLVEPGAERESHGRRSNVDT